MEPRKLQKTSGSTLTLSLPREWIVKGGLRAGDTVFAESREDGALILHSRIGPTPKGRQILLKATGGEPSPHLLRRLLAAHVAGYSIIRVQFPPAEATAVRRTAREFTRMTIGTEILEEERGTLVLEDLSNLAELTTEKCLRRMHLTVRAMHEAASEALTRGDKAAGEEVALRDGEVDRLQWMVAKHYSLAHRSLGGAGWPAAGMHHALLAARALERMADHAARIALLAGKVDDLTEPQRESLRQGTVRVVEVLDAAVAALFSGDVRAANHTIDTAIGVVASVDALRRRPSSHRGGLGETLALAVESLSRTAAYAADLAEIAINQAIEREAPPTPPAPVARTAAREAPRGRGHDAR